MSYKDILDNYTVFQIAGKNYKIAYDFNAIVMLQEKYDCGFLALSRKIDEIKSGGIKEMLEFCLEGFKKYHPNIEFEEIEQAQSYLELFEVCGTEFIRKVILPDLFDEIVSSEDEKKKKGKKGLMSAISSILPKRF